MIEHLRGVILHKASGRVVIEAGGVGYGVGVAGRTAEALGGAGDEARLWIYTVVREEELSLYGFAARGDREVFQVLLGVSGLGPKTALAILDHFDVEQIAQIVLSGNAQALKSVPGIGLKKAEKVLLELKGRADEIAAGIEPGRRAKLVATPAAVGSGGWEPTEPAAREAVAALESLQTPSAAARRAVSRALEALGPAAATEDLVREALRHRHA